MGADGSFSVTRVMNKDGITTILPNITTISVTLIAPGLAEVNGLTTTGINSRWGRARRSQEEPACWVSVADESDFKICAWAKKIS